MVTAQDNTKSTYTIAVRQDLDAGISCTQSIPDTDGDGVSAAMDIDKDGDGLIELCSLEGLDAIRYQLNGSGYQAGSRADIITTGCPTSGCRGYELVRNLDFKNTGSYDSRNINTAWTAGEGWLPIGSGNSGQLFNAVFEGNGHTISNLMINRPYNNRIGLFGEATSNSTMTNIGLLNVDNTGSSVGSLVGWNYGDITNSYATGDVSGQGLAGGLVGWNYGGITNSYTTVGVTGNDEVGGLVGANRGNIANSYAAGDVTSSDRSYDGNVGGLVGSNNGSITNSYATGDVITGGDRGYDTGVGGLVGRNGFESSITNSYATGDVMTGGDRGFDAGVGGLVGWNYGGITNSYATGDVTGNSQVGGLVGQNEGDITNSYARGNVTGNSRIGGLVGRNGFESNITNSYAAGNVSGQSLTGGLVGENRGDITNSSLQSTEALQLPTAATGIYSEWSTAHWDFGDESQYPALKYTRGSVANSPACGIPENPACGALLPNQFPGQQPRSDASLRALAVSEGTLMPAFMSDEQTYTLSVVNQTETIMVTATANNTSATIKVNGAAVNSSSASNIVLTEGGITTIRVEVTAQDGTINTYKIAVRRDLDVRPSCTQDIADTDDDDVSAAIDIDKDGDGLIELCDLESLDAIRHQVRGNGYQASSTATLITAGCPSEGCRGYELVRNLDFTDTDSYDSGSINTAWTTGAGWMPIIGRIGPIIQQFNAVFEGNGHTISNLMINRPDEDNIGLFAQTASNSEITNIGLLDVVITGNDFVGGLVGWSEERSNITNSHATGDVTGNQFVGGLAGYNSGASIMNSYAMSDVTGRDFSVGGLAGLNGGNITNSYAMGDVTGVSLVGGLVGLNIAGLDGGDNGGNIANSYATGDVTGNGSIGGLVGDNRRNITNSYATGNVAGQSKNVGGLVGWNDIGSITNSYAMGDVTGNDDVGGLVGWNDDGSNITNSYATGDVTGNNNQVGGLVGRNEGRIINSYAASDVTGDINVGGLAGLNEDDGGGSVGRITNSYARGDVTGNSQVGGLVGRNRGRIINSYTASDVTGDINVGSLVGLNEFGSITNSSFQSTEALQLPTAATGIYSEWSTVNWDFGDELQYPALKYTRGSDTRNSTCGIQGNPTCGTLLPNQFPGQHPTADASLRALMVSEGTLTPTFINDEQAYTVSVVNQTETITVTPTANNTSATITVGGAAVNSGSASQFIDLAEVGITTITVKVTAQDGTINTYTIAVRRDLDVRPSCTQGIADIDGDGVSAAIDIDKDGDGLIELCDLESLDAIRHQVRGSGYQSSSTASLITAGCPSEGCRGYELVRNLDFTDAGSYGSGSINRAWTTGAGWMPIIGRIGPINQRFNAVFEGNGHTISNLMVDRPGDDNIGLFAQTASNSKITNIVLLNVVVTGDDNVGSLVGSNIGDITNSYATGDVTGNNDVGDLVGLNNSRDIRNSGSQSTEALQLPTTATGIYSEWSTANWDFGNSLQYPRLKYTSGSDAGNPACGIPGQPSCGTLLPNQLPISSGASLSALMVSEGTLSPDFNSNTLDYTVSVANTITTITVTPTASHPSATITVNGAAVDSDSASDNIALTEGGITKIRVKVTAQNGIRNTYTIAVFRELDTSLIVLPSCTQDIADTDSDDVLAAIDIDKDGNGLIELCSLEGLDAIRHQFDGSGYRASSTGTIIMTGCPSGGCRGYELVRSLDFEDTDSYDSQSINTAWTTEAGWMPIGSQGRRFDAAFEGNGHTISNLMIDRLGGRSIGLFSATGIDSKITNIGLLSVIVTGSDSVGSLVGFNGGSITNSYATGDVSGFFEVGGLVGRNLGGSIANSYATADVRGQYETIGGLVGFNGGSITNSYATADVSGQYENIGGLVGWNDGDITNSYTTGDVMGYFQIGSLVGRNLGGSIANSYATADITRFGEVGGLVGSNQGNTTNSSIQSTEALQLPTTTIDIYSEWSTANWDFGNSLQYPTLKYAADSDPNNPACGNARQPICGTLLPNQIPISGDASLSALTVSAGTLSPAFRSNTLDYAVEVANATQTITVTPSSDANAIEITVNSMVVDSGTTSDAIALVKGGDTVITIEVTAQDRTTNTYVVTVSRAENVDAVVNLSALMVSAGTLSPAFDSETLSYTVSVANATQTITVTPTVSDTNVISITVNGETVDSGSTSTIVLTEGSTTTITIVVTAQDNTKNTYTIEVFRAPSTDLSLSVLPSCTQDIADTDDDGIPAAMDIDKDGDGLIELCSLEGLDAIRYQLDGSGYQASSIATLITTGCPDDGCSGYELVRSLDFEDTDSYDNGVINTAWTTGTGWQPIGSILEPFSGTFVANTANNSDITISNLMINRPNEDYIGLFAATNGSSMTMLSGIIGIRLLEVDIKGRFAVGGITGESGIFAYIVNSSVEGHVAGSDAWVGGLVGAHYGSIINGYAKGVVKGHTSVGGLVGYSFGPISNSYAVVDVEAKAFSGGLVGYNQNRELPGTNDAGGRITNSYASGSVHGGFNVGGLVGYNDKGILTDVYANGNVVGSENVGGLVGYNDAEGQIRNSYATGTAVGSDVVGGLVGYNDINATISNSYWDSDASSIEASAGGIPRTTTALQSSAPTGSIYVGWSASNWDFGSQVSPKYPTLKYTRGNFSSLFGYDADIYGYPTCQGFFAVVLPNCGVALPDQTQRSSQEQPALGALTLSAGVLEPPFDPTKTYYEIFDIPVGQSEVTLSATANSSSATITINRQSISQATIPLNAIGATTETGVNIALTLADKSTHYTIVRPPQPVLSGQPTAPCGLDDIDRDDDGLIEICDIEGLYMMRYQLDGSGYTTNPYTNKITAGCDAVGGCRGYELVRNLDFNNTTHYRDSSNQAIWTVDSDDITDRGWRPIGHPTRPFTAIFIGNGYTISNLAINRSDANYVGLFGDIASDAEIGGVGLSDVDVRGGFVVGALVARNSGGTIEHSYIDGDVLGRDMMVGGLVGSHLGRINNSYASGTVSGNTQAGGLVGSIFITSAESTNSVGTIINSYAINDVEGQYFVGGLVGSNSGSGLLSNSYATGSVRGIYNIGGLTGLNIGNIENSYARGNVDGSNAWIGGLVGENRGSIENNYVSGAVSGDRMTGGLAGANSGTITNSYWDIDTSMQTTSAGGRGLTTNELQTSDLLDGWSPEQWDVAAGRYPVLKYTAGDDNENPACDDEVETDLPPCGVVLSAQIPGLLDSLIVSDGLLTPEFDPQILTYGVAVDAAVDSIELQATAVDSLITIRIDESAEASTNTNSISQTIPIVDDGTEITVEVLAQNEITASTYTIAVTRLAAPLSSDASLSALVLSAGTLNPDFDSETLDYTVSVANAIDAITVAPTATNANATITVDGEGVESGSASSAIALAEGDVTMITVVVTAQDDTKSTYAIAVTRAPRPSVSLSALPTCTQDIPDTDDDGIPAAMDIDKDNDGLIELCSLEGLDAIRHQLDGSGYQASSTTTRIMTGCPDDGCSGYELVKSLDFEDAESYDSRSINTAWTTGEGWLPIGEEGDGFNSIFEGNSNTVSNLMIDRPDDDGIGFFAETTNSKITNIGLLNVVITGDANVGSLVGTNYSDIANSYATGDVTGDEEVGGLVGHNNGGDITNSYATGDVTGNEDVGGLVGYNFGSITNSYATGDVTGNENVGGLVGWNEGAITNSYATGGATGDKEVGGLVGTNEFSSSITNSYATGEVTGNEDVGGLVGDNEGSITNSYAIGNVTGDEEVGDLVGDNEGSITRSSPQSTEALQAPTTATGIYSEWSIANWDFGNSLQYPVLKYTRGPDENNPACGISGQPNCGTLLPSFDANLSDLMVSAGTLSQPFSSDIQDYTVIVANSTRTITVTPAAKHPRATIIVNIETVASGRASGDIDLAEGSTTTITVVVTAQDGITASTYTIAVTRLAAPLSSDASLSALVLSAGTLAPGFNSNILDYTVSVANTTATITVTPTARHPATTITVNDAAVDSGNPSNAIALTEGNVTMITIVVTAQDDTKSTYAIAVTRLAAPLSRDASLSALVLSAGTLNPDFDSETLDYTVSVANAIDTITVAPTATNANATITVNDAAVDSGNPSNAITLTEGDITTIIVVVTAQDNEMINTYTIAVFRELDTSLIVLPSCTQDIADTDNDGIPAAMDIDKDGDGLIELCSLEGLDAIRHQLDGRGYRASSTATLITTGCPDDSCRGYELVRSLDFEEVNSYGSGRINTAWTTAEGWMPIGSEDQPFSAVFEGNDHTISNLMIDRHADNIGLFGQTANNSQITNIGLLNVDVTGRDQVGGLVGINEGDITKSHATGDVTGWSIIGGLVGRNGDFNGDGSITNSYATGDVTGSFFNVGGLVGWNNDGGSITNSYATGDVTGGVVGGLVGSNEGDITSSYAIGDVTGDDDVGGGKVGRGDIDVGGLAGSNEGDITNSHATGDVNGLHNVGGLVGDNEDGSITKSYATGAVTGDSYVGGLVGNNGDFNGDGSITNSYATGDVQGRSRVGGLVGNNHGSITNSYATGAVTETGGEVGGLVGNNDGSITNSYATGDVTGDSSVGGLAGDNGGSITNSYATGDVTGDDNSVGGLAGGNVNGSITNSYATGDVQGRSQVGGLVGNNNNGGSITNSYATDAVTGSFYVGGLVGSNWGGSITNSYAMGDAQGQSQVGGLVGSNWRSSITNSYATGAAIGDDDVGGLVGENNNGGSITNSYATGAATGDDGVGGLVGRNNDGGSITNSSPQSTEALQAPTEATGIYSEWSIANWDFGTALQYPRLKYATGPDANNPACGNAGQPRCGTSLPNQIPISSGASLSDLTLTDRVGGTLVLIKPDTFDENTFEYTARVLHTVSTLTVVVLATDNENATIRVGGTEVLSGVEIDVGLAEAGTSTDIEIVVTAQDGITTRTYTVTVNRAATPADNDATLFHLALLANGEALNLGFDSSVTTYTVNVASTVDDLEVVPVANDNLNARIEVNGVGVVSNLPTSITLIEGETTTITVMVTAQDGSRTETYTIAVRPVAGIRVRVKVFLEGPLR
ncbi:MAG: cadherin-like beta sandwich domain-containing protein [Chromatiales bacterium]|nr:cadherin-like beta sandwich domain-containing protein [Chromatiales bacterium]